MHPLLRHLDPRRSLASSIGWLVIALSIGLVLIAEPVGGRSRAHQPARPARPATGQDRRAHRGRAEPRILRFGCSRCVHWPRCWPPRCATENQAPLRKILENVRQASPEFEWIDRGEPARSGSGRHRGVDEGASVADRSWFARGLSGSRIGDVRLAPMAQETGRLEWPAAHRDRSSSAWRRSSTPRDSTIGVIGTQLSSQWLLDLAASLGEDLRGAGGTDALLLGQDGNGTDRSRGPERQALGQAPSSRAESAPQPRYPGSATRSAEHAPGHRATGRRNPLSRRHATPTAFDALHALGWRVLACSRWKRRARPASCFSGRLATVLSWPRAACRDARRGAGTPPHAQPRRHRPFGRCRPDGHSAGDRRAPEEERSRAARAGAAGTAGFAAARARRPADPERRARPAGRGRARARSCGWREQERYAAIVRERLKIARDLHDTLAHSMMAMLAEIRLLKRISAADPGALGRRIGTRRGSGPSGLKEARAAIAQMRFNPVRDAGLAAALRDFVGLFSERTGIEVEFASDTPAGSFADERAETLFRITEESMRNIERHAGATRVEVSLREPDGGRGLVLTSRGQRRRIRRGGRASRALRPRGPARAGATDRRRPRDPERPGEGTTIRVELAPGMDS